MSNKSSFESRIMDFFTNASFERVDITYGLVKEIFKRRRAQQAEEASRVEKIAENPAPNAKVRRKRRTKAQIAQAPKVDVNAKVDGDGDGDEVSANAGAA